MVNQCVVYYLYIFNTVATKSAVVLAGKITCDNNVGRIDSQHYYIIIIQQNVVSENC